MISAIKYLLCPEKQKIIPLNGNFFSIACVILVYDSSVKLLLWSFHSFFIQAGSKAESIARVFICRPQVSSLNHVTMMEKLQTPILFHR